MHTLEPLQPRRVISRRLLTPDTFVLTFERRGMIFTPGRHISVGLPGDETREYSLFSGPEEEHLSILVRKVEGGRVSRALALLQAGDHVHVKGPKGKFLLSKAPAGSPLILVATGTGIAPFRSFLLSEPQREYTLVHGVRTLEEDFGREFVDPQRHVLCLSRSGQDIRSTPSGAKVLRGRVLDWLREAPLDPLSTAFLCGNMGMLDSAREILVARGLPEESILREKYF